MQPYPQAVPLGQPAQPVAQRPPAPQQPPALPPGTILLDRYLIQGYISGGGFGHIYKVLDSTLGYRRALKEAFYQDALTRRQFHLEAEFLLNARHPNLVRGYAVFEQMGRLYLVMDYVDGHTLEEIAIDHIRRTARPLPEARILDWVTPVCGALHALHSCPMPVIHRDVKPANIKVNRQGVPILIDLGLAKLYARGTHTIGAALAFTPGYAPPEQYRAVGATDARTDVYGMGATLFYLLTGYQPTEAPARLGTLATPPLRQLNPTISAATEATVIRAMELDPASRQRSALELETELRAARIALDMAGKTVGEPASAAPSWSLVCARCGAANPPVARHCMRCAAVLVRGEPGVEMDTIAVPDGAQANGLNGSSSLSAPPAPETEREDAVPPGPEQSRAGPDTFTPAVASAPVEGGTQTSTEGPIAHGDPFLGPLPEAPASPDDGMTAASSPIPPAALAPSSEPDQPAIAMPPLRRGPAPAAMPLRGVAVADTPDSPPWSAVADQAGDMTADWSGRSGGARPRVAAATSNVSSGRRTARSRSARATLSAPALWLRALPSIGRWHMETLSAAAPISETEVRSGIAGLMALVLAVGSLAAVQYLWALAMGMPGSVQYLWPLALAAPALALGHWCLQSKAAQPIPEARWLATLALVVSYTWLGLFTIGMLILALHSHG